MMVTHTVSDQWPAGKLSKLYFPILALFLLQPVHAAPGDDKDTELHKEITGIIDETIIIEGRSLLSLDQLIIQAENRIIEIHNTLNDDDKYDFVCRWEAPTGSLIKRRDCMPKFFDLATMPYAQTFQQQRAEDLYSNPTLPPEFLISMHEEKLRDKMTALIKEHPELLEAIIQFNQLNGVILKEKKRRNEELPETLIKTSN
ncbi:MAG: hypothetical protein HW386_1627 [Gammaproteobacteria bacterium]|nr:hypothetical protein [Gammaproteobacteria bacterium]